MEASFWNGKRASGIKDTIDFNEYSSVIEVIEKSFKKYSDRAAFTSTGLTMTYAEIDENSAAFASYLQNHTNLKPGDTMLFKCQIFCNIPLRCTVPCEQG